MQNHRRLWQRVQTQVSLCWEVAARVFITAVVHLNCLSWTVPFLTLNAVVPLSGRVPSWMYSCHILWVQYNETRLYDVALQRDHLWAQPHLTVHHCHWTVQSMALLLQDQVSLFLCPKANSCALLFSREYLFLSQNEKRMQIVKLPVYLHCYVYFTNFITYSAANPLIVHPSLPEFYVLLHGAPTWQQYGMRPVPE